MSDELGMPAESAYTIKYDLCIYEIDMNVWDYECFVHVTGLNIPFALFYLTDADDTDDDDMICHCCECVCESPKSNNNTHRCCAAGA